VEPPRDPPPERPEGEQQPEEPLRCPRCGAPHDAFQEYCLECGTRLVPPPAFGIMRRDLWTRESPAWLWAALFALLLVAFVSGALVAYAATKDEGEGEGGPPATSATLDGSASGTTATTPSTITIPPPTGTTTIPTLPTTTQSTTTGTTTTTTTTTTGQIMDWPANTDGFTIILRSVPTSEGRSAADATAQEAKNRGLPEVGVLLSSNYSSLRSGYWVTFSGVYDTKSEAVADLPDARAEGYPLAYVREISS
jgi:hypothetical protein